jgi:hypothetical protein
MFDWPARMNTCSFFRLMGAAFAPKAQDSPKLSPATSSFLIGKPPEITFRWWVEGDRSVLAVTGFIMAALVGVVVLLNE